MTKEETQLFDKEKWYIIRADRAGVFLGKIAFIEGTTVGVRALRRLYYWSGALDVSQLAQDGVRNPRNCKFSVQLSESDLSVVTNLIEFHPVTDRALTILNDVPVWRN